MDLYFLEKSAQMFFKMCENHPELCPHDFVWCLSVTKKDESGKLYKFEHYKCNICGKEEIKKKELENNI